MTYWLDKKEEEIKKNPQQEAINNKKWLLYELRMYLSEHSGIAVNEQARGFLAVWIGYSKIYHVEEIEEIITSGMWGRAER